MNTTIAAISTPKINSAISIIRISGPDSYKIISKICKKNIDKKGYTFSKEFIYDNDKIIDEIILLKFVAPRSFTGEDLLEINCHGGILVTQKILDIILENGARLAENGEFTKRAFLNNKLTIRQANSINNLIFAKTTTSMNLSSEGVVKKNNKFFDEIKENLFNLIGKIEVNIDYPEYDDVEQVTINDFDKVVKKTILDLQNVKNNYEKISYLYNGINIAIIGKPNVGKSSLLNALIKKDRAIVSNIKGTTRDTINESIVMDGLLLNFIDTAGIRNSKNKLEQIGIKKTYESIKNSDLVLFVIDSSKKIDKFEKEIMKKISNKKHIIVKNKMDLNKDLNPNIEGIFVSSKKNKIDLLTKKIHEIFSSSDFDIASNLSICSNNELEIIKDCIQILKSSLKNKDKFITIDVLVEDLVVVYKKICTLLGDIEDLDIIDKMFKNFCLGK